MLLVHRLCKWCLWKLWQPVERCYSCSERCHSEHLMRFCLQRSRETSFRRPCVGTLFMAAASCCISKSQKVKSSELITSLCSTSFRRVWAPLAAAVCVLLACRHVAPFTQHPASLCVFALCPEPNVCPGLPPGPRFRLVAIGLVAFAY